MMSTQQIETESRRAARRSAEQGLGPLIIEPCDATTEEVLKRHLKGVPFLGNRTPKGFKKVSVYHMDGIRSYAYPYEELFVDTSGFGSSSEPALTHDQFVHAVKVVVDKFGAVALSLSEVGQFQAHCRVSIPRK